MVKSAMPPHGRTVQDIAREFVQCGAVWVPRPPVGDRPAELLELFKVLVDDLGIEKVRKNEFAWHDPAIMNKDDKDGGIICKNEDLKDDPSALERGTVPDSKLFMQYREDTESEFRRRNWYSLQHRRFFDLAAEVHQICGDHMARYHLALGEACPEIASIMRYDQRRRVTRIMIYDRFRSDGSKLIAQPHQDRDHDTLHLHETHSGFAEFPEGMGGPWNVVELDPEFTRWFAGSRLQARSGGKIPALWHGATNAKPEKGLRGVVVHFFHLDDPATAPCALETAK